MTKARNRPSYYVIRRVGFTQTVVSVYSREVTAREAVSRLRRWAKANDVDDTFSYIEGEVS